MDRSVEVLHPNKSENRAPFAEFYNEETIRVVEERFSEDIRLFDYQNGRPSV